MKLEGLRVVRGPDWKWGDQDGGEGCAGTVVAGDLISSHQAVRAQALRRDGHIQVPDKVKREATAITRRELEALGKVAVQRKAVGLINVLWDSGVKADYRAGCKGAYDLRILDNANVGAKHPNVPCDSCKLQEILGMRWQCAVCSSNFCTECFLQIDKVHNGHTEFKRYENHDVPPVSVSVDLTKPKVKLQGIFGGAKVRRGLNWMYADEDGGEEGEVIGSPSVGKVRVKWSSSQKSFDYRRGFEGNVDLRAVVAASGGHYQPESLPILKLVEASEKTIRFAVGDRVKVDATPTELREKQCGHGGWNPLMETIIGEVGTVCRMGDDGDIRVRYERMDKPWCINPAVLKRILPFSIGQVVRVRQEEATIKEMQEKLGNKIAYSVAGETGRVIKVNGCDGLCVEVENSRNPFLVDGRTLLDPRWLEPMPFKTKLYDKLLDLKTRIADLLIEAAYEGDSFLVGEMINVYKLPVDTSHQAKGGMTALHMACRNGQIDVINLLLGLSADLEKPDEKGRRAVHFAVKGCQPEALKHLVSKGAELNVVTKKRSLTPLHKAADRHYTDCARILIENSCNLNLQDSEGNTPLHNAAMKVRNRMTCSGETIHGTPQVVIDIVESKRVDWSLRNKSGLNVLHSAVKASNICVAEYLLRNGPSSLASDVVTDCGWNALHIACLNGNYEMAKMLLRYFSTRKRKDSTTSFIIKEQKLKKVAESSPSKTKVMMEVNDESSNETQSQVDETTKVNESSTSPIKATGIDAQDKYGKTPLMLACASNTVALVELLVDAGANVNLADYCGDTPIAVLAARILSTTSSKQAPFTEEKCPKLYKMFNDLRHSKDAVAKYPLIVPMLFLLKSGSKLDVPNSEGKTALDAIRNPEIIRLFRQFGSQTGSKSPELGSCIMCPNPVIREYLFQTCGHYTDRVCSNCGPRLFRCINCKKVQPLKEPSSPLTAATALELERVSLRDTDDSDGDHSSNKLDPQVYMNNYDTAEPSSSDDDDDESDKRPISRRPLPKYGRDLKPSWSSVLSGQSTGLSLLADLAMSTRSPPVSIKVLDAFSRPTGVIPFSSSIKALGRQRQTSLQSTPWMPPDLSPKPMVAIPLSHMKGEGTPIKCKILPKASRKGFDLLEDEEGNTYSRRHSSLSIWQCTKKGEGFNKCSAFVREVSPGVFHLGKAEHRHNSNLSRSGSFSSAGHPIRTVPVGSPSAASVSSTE